MAVNRDPILKRCRSLQIDPSHMGIYKESKTACSFVRSRELSSSTVFWKSSLEILLKKHRRKKVSQVKTF